MEGTVQERKIWNCKLQKKVEEGMKCLQIIPVISQSSVASLTIFKLPNEFIHLVQARNVCHQL